MPGGASLWSFEARVAWIAIMAATNKPKGKRNKKGRNCLIWSLSLPP
jgi:hypothetical protein